ncbi:MAG: hypothetical protein JWR33_843 [Naasia sp.]|jgi:uncharacterized membrane-anchored protein|uniref:COG4705 family protein n=1 Tax=Naasia sp. TaxID=2546198 RepID=UPI00261A0607|nr:hypothetical protein [Naasia sp.]MCU1570102.1 hypothetical protein [Naasia sp.]
MTSTSLPASTRLSDLLRSKVPQVTVAFWIIKVFSTTVGETAADYLNSDLGFGLTLTSIVVGAIFLVALGIQFATKRYTPVVYWLTVVLISVVGTLITDNLTDVLGVPLWASTLVFSLLLAATFVLWFVREGTLSIHSIVSRPREGYYWLAILFTFALGTASGDFLSEALGFGYVVAAILFSAVIAVIAIAYFVFKANAVVCFWAAYVMTRPLGASLGDLTSQPVAAGGLGWGTTGTSLVYGLVIVAVVIYLSVRLAAQRRELEGSRLPSAFEIEGAV